MRIRTIVLARLALSTTVLAQSACQCPALRSLSVVRRLWRAHERLIELRASRPGTNAWRR